MSHGRPEDPHETERIERLKEGGPVTVGQSSAPGHIATWSDPVYSKQHGPYATWHVYQANGRYEVWRGPGPSGWARQRFMGTYRTLFFAKRRCRRGI